MTDNAKTPAGKVEELMGLVSDCSSAAEMAYQRGRRDFDYVSKFAALRAALTELVRERDEARHRLEEFAKLLFLNRPQREFDVNLHLDPFMELDVYRNRWSAMEHDRDKLRAENLELIKQRDDAVNESLRTARLSLATSELRVENLGLADDCRQLLGALKSMRGFVDFVLSPHPKSAATINTFRADLSLQDSANYALVVRIEAALQTRR